MAVNRYEEHRPREATITVSMAPDYSGDFVCDGTADDVEINAAIAYVFGLGGGNIFIERGAYSVDSSVLPLSTTTIHGTGKGTQITATGNFSVIDVNTKTDVLIENLYLVGTGGGGAQDGVTLDASSVCMVRNVWVENVGHDGILCLGSCSRIVITDCHVIDCGDDGINVNESSNTSIFGCIAEGCAHDGFHVSDTSFNVSVGECVSFQNTEYGITIVNSTYCTVTGCISHDNTKTGIFLNNGDFCTITGNVSIDNVQWGILLDTASDYNTITGNVVVDTDTYDGIRAQNSSSYNIIDENILYNNANWGIRIAHDTCIGNRVKNNHYSTNSSGAFSDLGTNTRLATKIFPFIAGGDIDGTAVWASYVSATASAKGWSVAGAADWAQALGQLPQELQQIVRIKIWAVALGAPIGAGGQMHLEINMNAGASNLAYTTEPVALANFDGEETDYVANDVVHWIVDSTDDADIGSMVGGMSIEVEAIYETGADPDGATNAVFRTIEIEYV